MTASAPAEVTGGDTATVAVKVANAGPSRSRLLRLTAKLPEGTAAGVPAELQGWSCATAGRDLMCERPQLMPSESTTLEIPVATDAVGARVARTLEFAVDSAVADPLPQDDRTTVSFDVVPRPPTDNGGGGQPQPQPSDPGTPPAATRGPGAPAKALALRVRTSRAQLLTNKLDVSFVVGCGPVACTATASAGVSIRGRVWRLKSGRASMAAGRNVRIRLGQHARRCGGRRVPPRVAR